jgi:hypothetical protein
LCLERAGIDLCQKLACVHVLAFAKENLLELAVDARFDGDDVVGLHRPDAAQVEREVAARDLRDADRHRRDDRGGCCRSA